MNSFVVMNCIWFVLVLFVNIIWYRRMNKLNLDWYKECIRILDYYSVELAKIIEGGDGDDEEETDE